MSVGFARFFGKSAISAASLLRRFDDAEFRRKLATSVVGIAYDDSAASTAEGQRTLDLLVDLLARLYPTVAIEELEASSPEHSHVLARLSSRARAINPEITLLTELDQVTALAVVGATAVEGLVATCDPSVIYVGSSGWIARASTHKPVGSSPTDNPFGAGAAACIAAATIFRSMFADELEQRGVPELSALSAEGTQGDLSLSLLDFSAGSGTQVDYRRLTGPIDIGETFLVGVGAIGNAAVWALSRTPGLTGTLNLIDGEVIALSNLQRYVLATEASVGQRKVDIAASAMHSDLDSVTSQRLAVRGHAKHWDAYIATRDDYLLEHVLLALDSAEDRIAVQSSLPQWIANAWTQPENLGVSRHTSFRDDACVACLYLPTQVRKSRDALYAEALGIQSQEEIMEIRRLLHSGAPVGVEFLKSIADRLGVPLEPLAGYANRPLEHFYSEALCGGVVLNLGGKIGAERRTEVPMAFQSALAGIILAAELVVHAGGFRRQSLPCRSEIDLLRPLGTRLNSPAAKHPSGRCICQDNSYLGVYAAKYHTSSALPARVGATPPNVDGGIATPGQTVTP
jgi:hypothetical protein